jgi:3-hydroxypropanoate dehydrogenase
LSDGALDTLFREARSYNRWQDKPVSQDTVQALYDLLKFGPTSANCSPARFVFLATKEAKERLTPHVMDANVPKIMGAPVAVIVGYHTRFYDRIPELFLHNPGARDWFSNDEELGYPTAFRNSTLQGAYLMLAARSLGLDCGPMSGFDNAGVDREFFPDGEIKSNFLCALGYGSEELLFPRSPRLAFDDACKVL